VNKIAVHIYGLHSNKTPFYYPEYRQYFDPFFCFVDDPTIADVMVSGLLIDFVQSATNIFAWQKVNPKLKLVVFSEEPLWDYLWYDTPEISKRTFSSEINHQIIKFQYTYLNHTNSRIFDFDRLPYFLTTESKYMQRYAREFRKNSKITATELKKHWASSYCKIIFAAEKRLEKKFFRQDKEHSNQQLTGLNHFRTQIAQAFYSKKNCLVIGKGWENEDRRQDLADWHLDKFLQLKNQSFLCSALENTHAESYMSEKFFDAMAFRSVPIYYFSDTHKINGLFDAQGIINLYGLDVNSAVAKLENFNIDDVTIEAYMWNVSQLDTLFTNYENLHFERKSVAVKTFDEFYDIVHL
jgi:hypothetical protein